jgi:hypothetical protein
MNEPSKAWGEQWLDAQQAMWKAAFPGMPTPASGAQPAHEATSLAEQFNELRDTWQASVAKWTDFAREATEGELPSAEKLREMFAPAAWAHGAGPGPGSGVLGAALQRVLEGPRYAVLWDTDRQLLELQKLTLQRDKAVAAYQAVVQKAWNAAFQRFRKALGSDPLASTKLTWRGLTDKWLAVANETLIEAHRSEKFIEAQREMLRAASNRHLQERKIAEAWCEAGHIPTRTEIDDLQRHVVELRREVRLLRRATPPDATPAAAARARKVPPRRPRAAGKRART